MVNLLDVIFRVLIPLVMGGILIYQGLTGRLLNRGWRIWTTLEERPQLYWTVLIIQAAIFVFAAYLAIR